MKIRSYLALLALVASPVFAASQVQSPVNAPATIAPGNIYKAGPNPQQAVDGGAPGNLVPLNTGKSVGNPGTGALEALLPVQTVTGTSKTFATADLQLETRRSNSGTAMTDTFPASGATGMANGTMITLNNVDATASDTITAGSGTTINGGATDVVTPGRSMRYVYDAPNTTWRRTLNTGTAMLAPNNLAELASAAAGRANLLTTLYVTPLDPAFAAKGNAKAYNAPTEIAAGSTTLGLQAGYWFNAGATVACTAGSPNVTITLPSGVTLPSYLVNNSPAPRRLITPATCGVAGGGGNNIINSISGSAPTYTVNLDQNMLNTTTVSSFYIGNICNTGGGFGTGGPSASCLQSNMQLTQCTVTAGNATITCPTNSFNVALDMTEKGDMGEWFGNILIHDLTGGCADFKAQINSSTLTTATLDTAPTCSISNTAYVQLYTGQLVFDASMVGLKCDVPNAGSGTADWKATISSVTDPFHAVMSSTSTTAWLQKPDRIICGTDDTAALKAMATYANANGISEAFFPRGHDYYFGTPDLTDLATLQLCNDGLRGGHIYYPQDTKFLRNAARCVNARQIPPPARTLNPKLNFRQAMSQPTTVKVDLVGDSLIAPGSNSLGEYGSLSRLVADQIQAANPSKTIVLNDRAIGGTTLCFLDPAGPNCSGNGSGIPTTAQIVGVAAWYTSGSAQWMSYVLADCPDVIAIRFSNDGSNLMWSSFWNVIAYTQTTSWSTACGSNPDIVFITPGASVNDSTQGTAYNTQEGGLFIGQFIRSAILAGDTPPLANGGRVGLIDVGQRDWLYQTGWDAENQPNRRANEVTFLHAGPNSGFAPPWPVTWPSPVLSWGLPSFVLGQQANETAATFWASVGQLILPLGNGSYATPTGGGGQSTSFTTGYPGNQLVIERDSGTGNFMVTGYTFYVPSTGASCSITSGAASLVCTASVANLGYRYANIAVAGAGSATCPMSIGGSNCLITTISNISTDGKTITLGTNATSTITSASTKLVFYHAFYGPTVTTYSTATYWSQAGISTYGMGIEQQGSRMFVRIGNNGGPTVFTGPIVKFGGHFLPQLGTTNTYSSKWYFVQTTSGAEISAETEEDGTWPLYVPPSTDLEQFGNCTPNAYTGPYGGGCTAHNGTLGILGYLDTLIANRDGLNFETASANSGATIVAAAAGSTTMATGTTWLNLTPAGTIASYTVTMPPNPAPNAPAVISTSQTVTSLTVSANTGQSISGAPSTLAANGAASFRWDALNATWRRVQ